MKKNKVIFFYAFIAVIFICSWLFLKFLIVPFYNEYTGRNTFIIENNSGKSASVNISVSSLSWKFELENNKKKRILFRAVSDSDFKIKVTFDDGKTLEETGGYFTQGAACIFRFKIKTDAINVKEKAF